MIMIYQLPPLLIKDKRLPKCRETNKVLICHSFSWNIKLFSVHPSPLFFFAFTNSYSFCALSLQKFNSRGFPWWSSSWDFAFLCWGWMGWGGSIVTNSIKTLKNGPLLFFFFFKEKFSSHPWTCIARLVQPAIGRFAYLRVSRAQPIGDDWNRDDVGWYRPRAASCSVCVREMCWSVYPRGAGCPVTLLLFPVSLLPWLWPVSSSDLFLLSHPSGRLPHTHLTGISLHSCRCGPSLSFLSPPASVECLCCLSAAPRSFPGSDLPTSCTLPLPQGWPSWASATSSSIRIHDPRATWA